MYAAILERKGDGTEEIITYGNKLERYSEPKYADAFAYTNITHNSTDIHTKFTHHSDNDRKMQIKIGKITDTSILQKIKSQNSSGFAELLSFAKSNNGIYDKTIDAKKNYESITYMNDDQALINSTSLQNDAYYFLYVKTLDENGTYISNEAVTLAQANVYPDKWYLFFYGSNDFKWADFGNGGTTGKPTTDGTIVNGKIPQTGVNAIIWTTLAIILIGGTAIHYIQYRKNNY